MFYPVSPMIVTTVCKIALEGVTNTHEKLIKLDKKKCPPLQLCVCMYVQPRLK